MTAIPRSREAVQEQHAGGGVDDAFRGRDQIVEMFDRDFEWAELSRFATYAAPQATLGVISGRRRQGKTFLLDALTSATGGFMFTVTETTEADALRQFGGALAAYLGEPVPFRFAN
ncbi:hypothetical protein [Sphaerisporangium album]|uniref:hypothetical protein n=1 Tax=Sphaerisporangium album TaxID=509200 RepID=UPI001C691B1B|nr:hypothetical protein [Sphaerisporangium album]